MPSTRQKQYASILEYAFKARGNACRGTLVRYFEMFSGHFEHYCQKTGRWRKHSSNFCFLCQGKIYPSTIFCSILPRDTQFCFPVVSGYRISQCRFAHFSASVFSQTARICMSCCRSRCREKAPLWNSFCLEHKRGITAADMVTLVFLRPFSFLHWLASNSIVCHRILLFLML